MGKTLRPLLAAAILAGLPGLTPAFGDELGSAKHGHALASRVCAACHEIEAGELGGDRPDPPGFQRIADNAAMTAMALRAFLTTPHRDMPNLILTDAEIDDLIAWIHSLKTP